VKTPSFAQIWRRALGWIGQFRDGARPRATRTTRAALIALAQIIKQP
jgi:hypothetical protein